MFRALSLLVLIGFLVVVTPSLARDLVEDASLWDLNINENDEDEMYRHGRHAPPPPHSNDGHAPPPHRDHHAPPQQSLWCYEC